MHRFYAYPLLGVFVMVKNKGFTLIEAVVVITIMAVTIAIGVPALNKVQAKNRIKGTANELAAVLKQGRSEALAQRRNFRLVAINAAALTNKWGRGWRLVSKLSLAAATDKTTLEQNILSSTMNINASPALSELVFVASTGMITLADGTLTDVVFSVCDSGFGTGIDVAISRLGRIAVTNHTTSATCSL